MYILLLFLKFFSIRNLLKFFYVKITNFILKHFYYLFHIIPLFIKIIKIYNILEIVIVVVRRIQNRFIIS